ncbi:vesicle-associated membrane protein 8, partial [Python bivittatus]|uniref:Vesicle-associated membrane protein 8 n=1 Tax=Python bivittatus TaxID=176946 RepID=A0A9F5MSE3_PYTBI
LSKPPGFRRSPRSAGPVRESENIDGLRGVKGGVGLEPGGGAQRGPRGAPLPSRSRARDSSRPGRSRCPLLALSRPEREERRLDPPKATCEEATARAEEEVGSPGTAKYREAASTLEAERSSSTMEGGSGSGPGMGSERVKNLQNEVEGVKNIMTQNVERILARGENLDHLRNKTEDLEATSEHFKTTSQKVARKYWWKNIKMIAIICIIAVIILILIILLATGVIPS